MMLDDSLNVLTVPTAKEGLEKLWGEQDISVLVLDLMLPDLNGLEVLRKIRSNEKTSDLPVVVITGSNNNEWMLRSANMSIQGYFKKPFDGAALTTRIMALSGDLKSSNLTVLKELWGSDFESRIRSVGSTTKATLHFIDNNFHKQCRRDHIASHLKSIGSDSIDGVQSMGSDSIDLINETIPLNSVV